MLENLEKSVKNAMLCMTRQCWEQGIAGQALLESKEFEDLEIVVYDAVIRQSEDGRLCNVENTKAVTDSAFNIPMVMEFGAKSKNAAYVEAANRNISFLLETAEGAETDGTLFHMQGTQEIWADSAAFLPYSLVKAGYVEQGLAQLEGICKRLYDGNTGLYKHMWDEKSGTYLRNLCWGVGNGWILTGMLRVMAELPEAYSAKRESLKEQAKKLLDAMLRYETDEHEFHDILDDETTFTESETAAMVAYAIYRAVSEDALSKEYLERAHAIRKALLKRVDERGIVMGAAGSPTFTTPGSSVECQAHVLMMEYWYKQIIKTNW